VDGVDTALKTLEPVALLEDFVHRTVLRRDLRPLEQRRGWASICGPHVGPDDAALLFGWVRGDADLVFEVGGLRLRRHVRAAAFNVELPAVVDAADAVFFVASPEEAGAAVRARGLHEADATAAITECDEVLAKETYAHRRAVGAGEFPGEQRGHPVAPHDVAHGGSSVGLHEELVVLGAQHRSPPLAQAHDAQTVRREATRRERGESRVNVGRREGDGKAVL